MPNEGEERGYQSFDLLLPHEVLANQESEGKADVLMQLIASLIFLGQVHYGVDSILADQEKFEFMVLRAHLAYEDESLNTQL